MRSLNRGLLCAACCAFALALPTANFAQSALEPQAAQSPRIELNENVQPSLPSSEVAAPRIQYTASAELPDSPGSSRAQQQSTSQQNSPSSQQNSSPATTNQANDQTSSSSNATQDQKLQRPVGTAAAEAPKVSGITAAEPAGIAIAPAKQHRVRTLAIKVGAIIGAGAAIGTVIALTEATPSKPPGAH